MDNSDYPVDRAVPIPPERGGVKRYPFKSMNVGDSFFTPESEVHPTSVLQAALHHGRRYGKRFTSRKVVEEGVSGVRVWRIEDPDVSEKKTRTKK